MYHQQKAFLCYFLSKSLEVIYLKLKCDFSYKFLKNTPNCLNPPALQWLILTSGKEQQTTEM